ncbi:MAG: type II toxin-antitoxin system Phd/YefM family antitoxin [Candidatus Daviesbacteria bacterium]|nr:type II toxin-antitoxin system Phd/YefM family antitoxin [Candidatus Daviesbacteria bacterium]
MITFPKTTSAREIQRNYKKIFDQVKKTKEPVVVMKNNKPQVAIVDFKHLEDLEAISAVFQSLQEIKEGKAKKLKGSLVDLWHEAQTD